MIGIRIVLTLRGTDWERAQGSLLGVLLIFSIFMGVIIIYINI